MLIYPISLTLVNAAIGVISKTMLAGSSYMMGQRLKMYHQLFG